MAAHVYRIVGEMAFGNVPVGQIKHAIGHAPGMNHFSTQHYVEAEEIIRAVERGEKTLYDLREFFVRVLPEYAAQWVEAGMPRNYEEWRER